MPESLIEQNEGRGTKKHTLIIVSVLLAVIAIAGFAGFAVLNHRTSIENPVCVPFYYYNSTAKRCQPQTISPACLPNHPNAKIYFACSGTNVTPSICPNNYTFNSTKSQCIINTNTITVSSVASTSVITSATTTANVVKPKFSQQFCLNGDQNATVMRYAIANGVKCFRADIYNSEGEITFVANATKAGAQYIGILDYATVGAQPSISGCISGCNWTLDTWNASIATAVADYPEIHVWEIYNEPLGANFASGYENRNASHYFNMIKSAYSIIKNNNPNATIVCFGGAQMFSSVFSSNSVQNEFLFYQQVWKYGAAKYCDAISLHAYNQPYYNFSQIVDNGETLEQSYNNTLNMYENLTGKPIWITETGIPSNNWTAGINYSEQKQAAFLRQDFDFFASHQFVKRIYWFHLIGYANRGEDYGLLNMTTMQPKPAWYSFLYFVDNETN
jgi:hypothetical protein